MTRKTVEFPVSIFVLNLVGSRCPLGVLLAPFCSRFRPCVVPRSPPRRTQCRQGCPECPQSAPSGPGASQMVDLGRLWCPQGSISSTFGVSRSYLFPTRAGSPAHAASMFTQGESKGDERRTRVGREEDERRTRGGHEEEERRTRRGQ